MSAKKKTLHNNNDFSPPTYELDENIKKIYEMLSIKKNPF